MKDLKSGEVYDLIIAGKGYKGVYLGQKNVRGKFALDHIILVNCLFRKRKLNYALFRFKDFRFEDNRLYLGNNYSITVPRHQQPFYDSLLETKLKKDYVRIW